MTKLAKLALIGCAVLLAACQHNEATRGPASTYCSIARTITWAGGDTRITKQQIDAHNRTYKRLCMSGTR